MFTGCNVADCVIAAHHKTFNMNENSENQEVIVRIFISVTNKNVLQ